MRTGEADAPERRNVVDRFQESGKVAVGFVWRLIVVHNLPEQLHFHVSGLSRLAHLSHDVSLRTHPFLAPRVRHDAEAAKFVAPFDDGYVGLHRILPPRDPQWKTDIVVRIDVDERRGRPGALSRLLDEHR